MSTDNDRLGSVEIPHEQITWGTIDIDLAPVNQMISSLM